MIGSEFCDDGNGIDTDGCTNACENARCGDTIIGPGEQCDDEIATPMMGVIPTAKSNAEWPLGWQRQCDDGNDIDTDNCTNACSIAACGDGIIQPPSNATMGTMPPVTGVARHAAMKSSAFRFVRPGCTPGSNTISSGSLCRWQCHDLYGQITHHPNGGKLTSAKFDNHRNSGLAKSGFRQQSKFRNLRFI